MMYQQDDHTSVFLINVLQLQAFSFLFLLNILQKVNMKYILKFAFYILTTSSSWLDLSC